jgi:cysteine desulfurase
MYSLPDVSQMNIRPERHPEPTMATVRPIYLDHHATTPVDARIAEVMVRIMTTQFGNPNDRGHIFGEEAAELIAIARGEIARLVGADSEGVVLLRSASIAAEAAISNAVINKPVGSRLRVATTTVEHRAILDALAQRIGSNEVEIEWLQVDDQARISLQDVREVLQKGCDLLCIMAANNEVGTVYPIEKIAGLAQAANVPLLVDATQAAGHLHIDMENWGISYLLMAAHKMYGPKGAAALIVGRSAPDRLRQAEKAEGTPNVPAIVGFGEACRIRRAEMVQDGVRVSRLRDRLESLLVAKIDGLVVNGDRDHRMNHSLHVSFLGVPNEAVVSRLSRSVAISTGAACRSGTDEPSHVLKAMRLPEDVLQSAIRIGLGRTTSEADVELAAGLIAMAVNDTRRALNAGAER